MYENFSHHPSCIMRDLVCKKIILWAVGGSKRQFGGFWGGGGLGIWVCWEGWGSWRNNKQGLQSARSLQREGKNLNCSGILNALFQQSTETNTWLQLCECFAKISKIMNVPEIEGILKCFSRLVFCWDRLFWWRCWTCNLTVLPLPAS